MASDFDEITEQALLDGITEQALLDAADELLRAVRPDACRRAHLACAHCEATLFRPTTLGDGSTYCAACVPKLATPVGREVGFGKATNKVLEHLCEAWFPAGHLAAQLRQEGNAHFAAGRHLEAVAVYTTALTHFSDAVLLSNRAAANLKLGEHAASLRDACLAAQLATPGSRLWAKSLFRLGSALNALGERPEGAVAALAAAAAWSRAQGEPLDAALRALREALGAFSRAHAADREASFAAQLDGLRSGGALARALDAAAHLPPAFAEGFGAELAAARRSADAAYLVPADKVLASRESLECALCVEQLHEPTAIPCGHVLCRPCLSRALDQAFDAPARCPLCRDDLGAFLRWLNVRAREQALRTSARHVHGALQLAGCTELQQILAQHMPAEVQVRAAQVAASEAAAGEGADADDEAAGARATATIPVFVCALALPGVRCPLHIFEPRFRLMMRRCIDSGRREFGMMAAQEVGFGTTLLIDEYVQLPDGRSRLATTGSRRFKVLDWGNKDGYLTAKVEWIDDAPLAPDDAARAAELGRQARARMDEFFTPMHARGSFGMLEEQVGPLPEDDALLPFWASAVLAQGNMELQLAVAFGDGVRTSALERLQLLLASLPQITAGLRASGAAEQSAS